MTNWQNAQYGPAIILDLRIVKIVVNEELVAQGQPTVYYYSYGPYRKSGFATYEAAQAAALKAVRAKLNNALALLNSLEASPESEATK